MNGSKCRLLSMPPEILDKIAIFCALEDTNTDTHTGDLTCSPNAPTDAPNGTDTSPPTPRGFLYDTNPRPSNVTTPPVQLFTLQLVCKKFHGLLNHETNPRLYAEIFRFKFDTEAITRRFGYSATTSSCLSQELKRRCQILKRMRQAVFKGKLDDEIEPNLWLSYLMMTENDGKNILHLKYAQIFGYLALLHSKMLEESVEPGFPKDTVEKSLALHLIYLLTDPETLANESRDEAEERLFLLRPFVFAAHRFDAYFAPWTLRGLPLDRPSVGGSGDSKARERRNPFLADLTPRIRSRHIQHCIPLTLSPPPLAQAACHGFFLKVEQDPAVLGMSSLTSKPTLASTRSPLTLRSLDHDQDIQRLLSCTDPFTGGLPGLTYQGKFEGTWEGRFSFFDFDSYREMLAGRSRSLYEGPFGEQPQIWKIKEKIVKLNGLEGGKGNLLAAGYESTLLSEVGKGKLRDTHPDDALSLETSDAPNALDERISEQSDLSKHSEHSEHSELPQDWSQYPTFPNEPNTPRYELLLSGTGHSAWGKFILRGRVRSWDGMVIMTKEYKPDGRGKWLYRGYIVAGNRWIGRWRDTFTPENMFGYEGVEAEWWGGVWAALVSDVKNLKSSSRR